MKKVIRTYFDLLENELLAITKEFPYATVEHVWPLNNDVVGAIIDTNDGDFAMANSDCIDVNVEPYNIETVEKLPTLAKATDKTYYVLSAANGDRAAGTVWLKNGDAFDAVSSIDVFQGITNQT